MYHKDKAATMDRPSLIGACATQGADAACEQPSRTLANDLDDLAYVINELDDQLGMLAAKLQPVLRSGGEVRKESPAPFTEPPASCQLSAALIEGTRRLRFMLGRASELRHDIAL